MGVASSTENSPGWIHASRPGRIFIFCSAHFPANIFQLLLQRTSRKRGAKLGPTEDRERGLRIMAG